MGSGIIGAEVGFDFDDASAEEFAALPADQDFAEEIGADEARVAVVEGAGERPHLTMHEGTEGSKIRSLLNLAQDVNDEPNQESHPNKQRNDALRSRVCAGQ